MLLRPRKLIVNEFKKNLKGEHSRHHLPTKKHLQFYFEKYSMVFDLLGVSW